MYLINTPYKYRHYATGGMIISRNNSQTKKYKVVTYGEYGYGSIGYGSTLYFYNLKSARNFLKISCNHVVHNLSQLRINQFTA